MFEKISRFAETAANTVGTSRRGFLGRLGQSALAVVGVLGGLAATAATARAGSGSYLCCTWHCEPRGGNISNCYPPGTTKCPLTRNPCSYGWTVTSKTVNACNSCK
jgi:hypothetical protein